jgi:hypothetical protein
MRDGIEKFAELESYQRHLEELIKREKRHPAPMPQHIRAHRLKRFTKELEIVTWAADQLRPMFGLSGSVDLLPYVKPEEEKLSNNELGVRIHEYAAAQFAVASAERHSTPRPGEKDYPRPSPFNQPVDYSTPIDLKDHPERYDGGVE